VSADRIRRQRWRLVLGDGSEEMLGGLAEQWHGRAKALHFLYGREYGPGRNVRAGGSLDPSSLTVPEWINQIHELFPRRTIERLEKDALERYQLDEIVTNPEVLRRATPNASLLKAVLHTKHLMNREVLAVARDLVRAVVDELMQRLAREIRAPFLGVADRRRRSTLRIAKNFDVHKTIRANLRHWDPAKRRLVLEAPQFFSRVRRHADRWKVIVLVDESGSMASSVIHAAVTAAIFVGLRMLRTHLVLFDTSVVDVTDHAGDPVETIMKVQLGGGTDIGGALSYAAGLVEDPRRTIIVLVSDFEEGAPEARLLHVAASLLESGVTLLGLAALDPEAQPRYDRHLAQRLVNLGAHVGAMTPGELAEWVASKVR
jgi:Mg-chelatase subunit ChlD